MEGKKGGRGGGGKICKIWFKDIKKMKMGCDFERKYEEVIETFSLSSIGMGALKPLMKNVTLTHIRDRMKNIKHLS